jgi:hypothetical protein
MGASQQTPPVWKVKFTADIALHGIPGARCIVTVDATTKELTVDGNTSLEFILDPGEHALWFSCTGPNPYFGCMGHAGGVNEAYQDLTYNLGIDAESVTREPIQSR